MTRINHLVLTGILFFSVFISCKKEDNSNQTPTNTTNIVQQGKWKITYYNDNGKDETANFNGYTFSFEAGGKLVATKSTTLIGSWSSGTDDSQPKLNISFLTSPLSSLNDDWHILEQTAKKIKLEDVNGGNGGTDYLTFEQ
jgi:hypothetical protein